MKQADAPYNEQLIDSDFTADESLSSNKTLLDLSKYEQHLTLKRILIAVAILLFLIAWNRGVALLYAMDALLVATLLVAWFFPRFNLRSIDVELSLPEKAYEGDVIPLLINTRKTGLFNRYMIELQGDFPFYSRHKTAMKLINVISEAKQHRLMLSCDCRGHYQLESYNLQTGFPLGLTSARKQVKLKNNSSILIYPTPLPLQQFEIAKDPSHSALQTDNNPKAGGHDEYIGIREYRHGDSPRHIHWPSSAKRGELVVREFQQNSTTHLNIVLDLNPVANFGEGKHSTLEYSIKITATLIKFALENQYSFSISGLAKEPFEISNKSGSLALGSLENALEALAWLKADGDYSYTHAIRRHMAQNNRGGTLVLFDCLNDHQISHLLPELQAQHYYPLIYKFDKTSFVDNETSPPKAPTKNQTNTMTTWQINNGCDLRLLFS